MENRPITQKRTASSGRPNKGLKYRPVLPEVKSEVRPSTHRIQHSILSRKLYASSLQNNRLHSIYSEVPRKNKAKRIPSEEDLFMIRLSELLDQSKIAHRLT